VEASLGLALYVLGYGLGSLLLSPLTEIPSIGRNPPYAISGLLFIVLCIPGALVDDFAGLMVIRLLLGLMASPPLATSGASLGDIWHASDMPAAIGIWSLTSMAPALGPTLSSFAVERLGWRFGVSWELLIMVAPVILLLIITVPETSEETILYYRAKIRKERLSSDRPVHPKGRSLSASALLWDALVKPWEINIKDPALLFTTLYFGLVYGIYYTFFESLPLVFPIHYGFSAESTGLVFLGAIPATMLAFAIHASYMGRVAKRLRDDTFGELENLLIPGAIASWAIPAGLFLYGQYTPWHQYDLP
jgi:MFS transporter, DHA1 family, multidrug resistance protein